jgi:phage terminase large subunit
MSLVNIEVTKNFKNIVANKDTRILILEGSSRSGKTIAVLHYIIFYCFQNKNKIITIAREELVVAKRTVLVDLIEILNKSNIPYIFNKSESLITLNQNTIRVIGLDSKEKVLGLKQDIIYINEGLTIEIDIYLQLLQRTTEQLIVDYNPSYDKHFLYDWADNRDDCLLLKSTIFDNHLAPRESIKQILSYEPTEKNIKQNTANEFYWRVYGLGERFKGEDVVIRKLYNYNIEIEQSEIEWELMGGDFGFAMDWTVLVKVTKQKNSNCIYCRVLLRDKGLTNQMIAEKINNNPNIDNNIIQIWDSAEKKSIMELRLAGVNAIPATKGAHSIYFGIQKLQNFKIYVYQDTLSSYLYDGLIKLRFKMNFDGSIARDTKGYPILVDTGLDEVDALRYALEKYVTYN